MFLDGAFESFQKVLCLTLLPFKMRTTGRADFVAKRP